MITAEKTFAMLGNRTLWDTARQVHDILTTAEIPYAVVGGVAVCLHGYQRNTIDLDLLVRPNDRDRIVDTLVSNDFRYDLKNVQLTTPDGFIVQFVQSGDREGQGQDARFPDPGDPSAVTMIESLTVLTLYELIQSKLAYGLGNLRRTHKDFADVVELISVHRLNKSAARHLHPSVRDEFRALVERVGY